MTEYSALSESLEDYLEVILSLEKASRVARAKDIAEKMGVKRGSVTGALQNLAQKGLIHYEPYSFITLTEAGKKIAHEITRRHGILLEFFADILRLDLKRADSVACRLEHGMDRESMDRLIGFVQFVNQCPRAGKDWSTRFQEFCGKGLPEKEVCQDCLAQCHARVQE
ncbi:MAG: metal-dependent transcriptional regulator [Desulfatibacillum sp.]|nr:metal-dependent transcriptional regulator [Desulfatibacillum sp.]